MKRFLPLLGLFLLAPSASAADTNLYEIFREQVEKEMGAEQTDAPVVEFIQGIYKDRWGMSVSDVEDAIQGKPWLACAIEDDTLEVEWKRNNLAECDRALKNIQLIAIEEQQLRVFGRQLQRISSAQELPLTEFPGRPFHLATDLSGIINIWRAGTGSVQQTVSGAVMVRTKKISDEEAEGLKEVFEKLAGAVQIGEGGVNQESGIAQIWYYQYGALLRMGARQPTYPPPLDDGKSGPGTERQYLFKDDFSAGTYLHALWGKLPRERDDFDPPLGEGEVAYFLFPEKLTNMLPENIVVWARMDAGRYEPGVGESHWLGDAGLAWKYPIEPLLPSLLSNRYEPGVGETGSPILGGRYPPEPAIDQFSDDNGNPLPPGTKKPLDGRGLCSMALAQRGYLCRPYKATDEQRCPDEQSQSQSNSDENVITLVSCTLEDKPTLTVAGADVCRDIDWRSKKNPQNSQEGSEQQGRRCDVDFYQASDCGGADARADFKTAEGKLGICVTYDPGTNLTYALEHELVHSQQFCTIEKPGNVYEALAETENDPKKLMEKQDALCCRLEGEAYLVNCKRMYEDGLLRNPDGSRAFIKGVEVTPQVCMEISRLKSCQWALNRDVKCPMSANFTVDDLEALKPLVVGNPKNLPDTFEKATNPDTMDARVAARVRTIERHVPICTPGTETLYKNTIGNNACYLGQCVEETLELHRVTAGRSPAVVGDGAFPHDDPNTGDALATLLRSVPASSPPLPSYRPQLIARTLDDALCQLQGLPAATPPHLCAFSPSRRLELPRGDRSLTGVDLRFNQQEQQEATLLIEHIASGLGSRIGTDMQGQYLRIGTKTLSEVVALANTLFKEAITVTFPTNMCPLSL